MRRPDPDPRFTLIASSFGLGMALLDVTAGNVALPSIRASLHTDAAGLSWVVDGYTLPFASFLLLGGGLGDRLGAKRLFTAGLVVFTAASAMCVVAPDIGWLIAARVLQGIGAALFMPASLSILGRAYPEPVERARAIGIWSSLTAVTGASGPVVGGALIHAFGWRSIFLINVPIGVVGVLLALRFVQRSPASPSRGFDLGAQAAGAFGLAALTWALIERSARGWSSPLIVLAFVCAAGGIAAFVALERRSADPMLPLHSFAIGPSPPRRRRPWSTPPASSAACSCSRSSSRTSRDMDPRPPVCSSVSSASSSAGRASSQGGWLVATERARRSSVGSPSSASAHWDSPSCPSRGPSSCKGRCSRSPALGQRWLRPP